MLSILHLYLFLHSNQKHPDAKPGDNVPEPNPYAEEKTQHESTPTYLKSTEVFDVRWPHVLCYSFVQPMNLSAIQGEMLRNERESLEELDSKTDSAAAVMDEAFIPLAFAEETIESLTKKLMQIRGKHHEILGRVDKAYAVKAKHTQQHYTEYIKNLKATATEKIMHYKHIIQVSLHSALECVF